MSVMPSGAVSPSTNGRYRARALVSANGFRLRAPGATHATAPGYARYVGRVGALAVAFGVGSAVASMPTAFADTTRSADSSATDSDSTSASAKAPARGTPRARRGSAGEDSTLDAPVDSPVAAARAARPNAGSESAAGSRNRFLPLYSESSASDAPSAPVARTPKQSAIHRNRSSTMACRPLPRRPHSRRRLPRRWHRSWRHPRQPPRHRRRR